MRIDSLIWIMSAAILLYGCGKEAKSDAGESNIAHVDDAAVPPTQKAVSDKLKLLNVSTSFCGLRRDRLDFTKVEYKCDKSKVGEVIAFLDSQTSAGNLYAAVALGALLVMGDHESVYSSTSGLGFKRDTAKAQKLFDTALNSSDIQLRNTALLYSAKIDLGLGNNSEPMFRPREPLNEPRTSKEVEQGILKLVRSSKDGNLYAARVLALIYGGLRNQKGDFICKPDEMLEFYWLKRSAEIDGYAPSAYKVGMMYLLGDGVMKNSALAAQYFKLGAKKFEQVKKIKFYPDVDSILCAEALAYMIENKHIKCTDADFAKKVRADILNLSDLFIFRRLSEMYSSKYLNDSKLADYWFKETEKIPQEKINQSVLVCKSFNPDELPTNEEIRLADEGDVAMQSYVGKKFEGCFMHKTEPSPQEVPDDLANIQKQAIKYLELAACAGDYESKLCLAHLILRRGPYSDRERYLYWAREVAKSEKGEAINAYREAVSFKPCNKSDPNCGVFDKKMYAEATAILEAAAERGDYSARWILRSDYSGFQTEAQKKKYFYWLNKQCEIFAEPFFKFRLGLLYFYGIGTKEDKAKGLEIIENAAMGQKNSEDAMYFLHWIYGNGIGVAQDKKLSGYWLKKYFKNALYHNCKNLAKAFGGTSRGVSGKILPVDKTAQKELEQIAQDLKVRERKADGE